MSNWPFVYLCQIVPRGYICTHKLEEKALRGDQRSNSCPEEICWVAEQSELFFCTENPTNTLKFENWGVWQPWQMLLSMPCPRPCIVHSSKKAGRDWGMANFPGSKWFWRNSAVFNGSGNVGFEKKKKILGHSLETQAARSLEGTGTHFSLALNTGKDAEVQQATTSHQ